MQDFLWDALEKEQRWSKGGIKVNQGGTRLREQREKGVKRYC